MSSLRRSLRESGHDATVLTALDEIAWLFNMRGSDIPFNPVFKAYAVISEDQMVLYLDDQKQTSEIEDHLKSEVRIRAGGLKDYSIKWLKAWILEVTDIGFF